MAIVQSATVDSIPEFGVPVARPNGCGTASRIQVAADNSGARTNHAFYRLEDRFEVWKNTLDDWGMYAHHGPVPSSDIDPRTHDVAVSGWICGFRRTVDGRELQVTRIHCCSPLCMHSAERKVFSIVEWLGNRFLQQRYVGT